MQEKSEIAQREEKILEFWEKNKTFEKSLKKPSPKGEFVFYDGPPFATGLPHYGSLLSSIIKDVIPRYKTMKGYHVRRRWGWDCHGLPIENMVEKELGLKDKKEIESIGIEKFNQACKNSVLKYVNDWKYYINRIGRWVEFENSYKTMDSTYTESVWWALKKIWEKGLLYKGRKVLLYCPRCETPLAKAEVAMDNSYKDVTEETITIKFRIKNPEQHNLPQNSYFLAWTTTPWTLPGNVALAIGKNIDYSLVKKDQEYFILASELITVNFKEDFNIEKKISAKDLIGLEYEPLFEIPKVSISGKKSHYVAEAGFVNTEEGTGIVHTAVIYGEDDYELGLKFDLPMIPLLDSKGHFNTDAPNFIQGQYFKKSEKLIKENLENRNLIFSRANYTHSYPHCHRCDTTLLYNAISSWFINIQAIKNKLIKNNEGINWFPKHLKHGRFLNTIENAPDWTISRNRYWASPLPIWVCEKCNKHEVIGSLAELKEKSAKSGNRYFVMRHGEAESNVKEILSSFVDNVDPLTEVGRKQVGEAVSNIKNKNIDLIIASPFQRTKETAEIIRKGINLSKESLILDDNIVEVKFGELNGTSIKEYGNTTEKAYKYFYNPFPNGESFLDIKKRMSRFLYSLEDKYKDKNILIVSHQAPLRHLVAGALGLSNEKLLIMIPEDFKKFGNAEVRELDFTPIPHAEDYELDLHRPFIDEVTWKCKECDGKMKRVPEVVDGWVEASSMPFAEYHYPFENKDKFDPKPGFLKKPKRFPGDFVAEYIAQTRTWFYYMHVISTILFNKESFKNVSTTGTILAEDGSKMSKSKGNFTSPIANYNLFGSDALRFYLMTSVVMQAEDIRFSDQELREIHNKVVNILQNVFKFYKLYKDDLRIENLNSKVSSNILDKWILSKLNQLNDEVDRYLDVYDTVKAGRPIKDFINDLSTWYVRRSRNRFKSDNFEDQQNALSTTRTVLMSLSKIIAPFMPFIAEDIYQEIKTKDDKESVHLCDWPKHDSVDKNTLDLMKKVREVVSLGLEARDKAKLKVRQPLSELKIKNQKLKEQEDLLQLIKDEINVKEIIFDEKIKEEVKLNMEITSELKREGNLRELTRAVQDLRKQVGLTPKEIVNLIVESGPEGRQLIKIFESEIKKNVVAREISFTTNDGLEIKIDDLIFKIKLEK